MVAPKPRENWKRFHDQARIGRRPGRSAPRGVPHHALQLHPADHRQRDGRHQRHVGEPGRGVLRPRHRRPPGTGPQDRRSAPQGSRRAGREHRAGRAAAAIGDRPGPGPLRPAQRPHRRREPPDQHGPGRANRSARCTRATGASTSSPSSTAASSLRPGHRPLAGPHRRRHSRAAGASGHDQDRRRADDHRPRERRPPHDRALRHQRPRPGRLRGRRAAAVCRTMADRRRVPNPATASSGWGCSRTWPGRERTS